MCVLHHFDNVCKHSFTAYFVGFELKTPFLVYCTCKYFVVFTFKNRNRLTTQHTFINIRVSVNYCSIYRNLLTWFYDNHITNFYLLNGHGGNVAPAMCAFQELYAQRGIAGRRLPPIRCRLRSWWDFESVNRLRSVWYGSGEGMHATPSEIAITRHVLPGCLPPDGLAAPAPLAPAFMRLHAGDNHPDSALHRAQFPDGRVGSHSALGMAEQGMELVSAAAEAMIADYQEFLEEPLE